jgi:hypothetical protein
MNIVRLIVGFSVCVVAVECRSEPRATESPIVASAAEAKAAFGSQEELTRALERRWPISAINEFCIPERRHNDEYQNLVMDTKVVWKGVLHANAKTSFDKVEWYATTEDGRALQYSLNVQRGGDNWLLEIGSERTLTRYPHTNPDPKQKWFVGHR